MKRTKTITEKRWAELEWHKEEWRVGRIFGPGQSLPNVMAETGYDRSWFTRIDVKGEVPHVAK